MANDSLFSNKNVKNNVSRNGFDLSKRVLFTAKVGELLPIYNKRVMPGDKFRIDVSSFTRTQPVNTAAYTRIKEYYDFFYVPYRLLWRNAPASLTQMSDVANTVALSPTSSLDANQNVPYFSSDVFNEFISNLVQGIESNRPDFNNQFGFSRFNLIFKLLSYLGYFNFNSPKLSSKNLPRVYKDVCAFPLLAYQKIYFDFFRNPQWEHNRPECYNVDYLTNATDLFGLISPNVGPDHQYWYKSNMFDLRYCNYQKDLFFGALPNTQFGSESTVSINGVTNLTGTASIQPVEFNTKNSVRINAGNFDAVLTQRPADSPSYPDQFKSTDGTNLYALSGGSNGSKLFTSLTAQVPVDLSGLSASYAGELSILALRRATALQKYKEISQLGNTSYRSQIKKHFDVDIPESLGSMCTYIGGFQNAIAISEVVNQNLDTSDSSALIRGKGTSVQMENQPIQFDVQEHGIIMCIYHAIPLMDYVISGQSRDITAVDVTDYAIPEFDRLGLEPADIREFFDVPITSSIIPTYGYLPRYYSYKSDVDNILGAFCTTLPSWAAPFDFKNVIRYFEPSTSEHYSLYNVFKVNPSILNNIFPVNADSSVDTDYLLCTAHLNINAVRNLDFNGLPY